MHASQDVFSRALQEDSKQTSTFAVCIPFAVIASIVVGLRFYVRCRLIPSGPGLEDYFVGSGFVFTLLLSISTIMCGWYGAGVHTTQILSENLVPMLKWNYVTRIVYGLALCFVKVGILTFYLRLDPRKRTRWTVYVLMVFVVLFSIASILFVAFVCTPPSTFWDPVALELSPEKCVSQRSQLVFFNFNGICNIVQDVSIFLLPIPVVWDLRLPLRQKLMVGALLSVGLVAVAAGCVRFYYVLFLANEEDIWYYMADSLNWCNIELYAAIICSSAFTFKALVKAYIPRLWNPSQRDSSEDQHPRRKSDRLALGSVGGSSKKATGNRKYGFGDITTVKSESEEAIVPTENKQETV